MPKDFDEQKKSMVSEDNIKSALDELKRTIDQAIDAYFDVFEARSDKKQKRLLDAMRYSATGGKRIRGMLVTIFSSMCKGKGEDAAAVALAIELFHAFSLVHDDLPAMDDDDLRRGQPSCHRKFDEATAILAGDALALHSFSVVTSSQLEAESKAEIVSLMSYYGGYRGMCGGQMMDIIGAETEDEVIKTSELKTADIIAAACVMGVISAGSSYKDNKKSRALINSNKQVAEYFGRTYGQCFQMTDDILDVTASTEEIGKPQGSDVKNSKKTYVDIYGVENCIKITRNKLNELLSFCVKLNAPFLKYLTEDLLNKINKQGEAYSI